MDARGRRQLGEAHRPLLYGVDESHRLVQHADSRYTLVHMMSISSQYVRQQADGIQSGAGAPGPRDWDAATYDRVSDAHARWGATVLDRLTLRGDECVLDAGCGSGRVTEQLLSRLPHGQVVALDASPTMLA